MARRNNVKDIESIRRQLGDRVIVLVGLMGAGKSTVGRRLAEELKLPFVDADHEIEAAAGKTIPEIFADHGEAYFRDGERKVIARLLDGGAAVLATGGGAYVNDATRELIGHKGIAVWLKADLSLLMRRVSRRSNRPLLKNGDPEAVMRKLIDERYPVYAKADITVMSRDVAHTTVVNDVIKALAQWPGWSGRTMNKPDFSVESSIVHVALGARSYDIAIAAGLLADAGNRLKPLLSRPVTAIVTDANVARLHLKTLEDALAASGIASTSVVLPAGETTKSYQQLAILCDRLLACGIERRDAIIALGGGVIGDLAGFAAAILRRGIDFIQIPTTLLAQVDSSVGGKTGINSPFGKNLIGAFHQPKAVLADIALLDTLPRRELAAGYAEIAKYGLLGDASFFSWLESSAPAIFAGDRNARADAIKVSCEAKARIVAEDETETGIRALLNLGHTFAHALEAATGYGERLLHGEAVAVGMAMAFRFSHRLQFSPEDDADRMARHLASVGLPVTLADIEGELPDAAALLAIMRQDKKAQSGKLTFVLVHGIGRAFIARDIPDERVLAFLSEELAKR